MWRQRQAQSCLLGIRTHRLTTCDLCSLRTGLFLAEVPRSSLPPRVKRIQARNLDLGNTILEHPCVCMGTLRDPGKEEAPPTPTPIPVSCCSPLGDPACGQRWRRPCGVARGHWCPSPGWHRACEGSGLTLSYLPAWLCLQASECQQDQLHPARCLPGPAEPLSALPV